MSKVKFIPCDIYKRGVNVFIGEQKEFEAWVKKTYADDDEERAFAAMFDRTLKYGAADTHFGYGYTVIRLDHEPNNPADIAAAGHEAMHAADSILTWCGVEWQTNSSNESYTYLMEWILRCMLESFGWEEIK